MKKLFYTTLVLTVLLAVTAGTAFAGSALELRSVGNNQGGPTFVFRVTGEFSDSELTGFVQVQGGDDYPLYCSQTSPTEVVCHASKKVGGHDVVVGFGGARFWTYVKEFTPRGDRCGGYSYPVYDANTVFPVVPTGWVEWTTVCTDTLPAEGYGYYIPGAPSNWTSYYEFDLGSNPTPGDMGFLFGLPYIGPGYYQ